MKLLLIADTEERVLWDGWSAETAARLSDVDIILSAGDLDADYLEFLVTMLNVPLVYVRGNHDGNYDRKPPEGCIDADGRVVEISLFNKSAGSTVKVTGDGENGAMNPGEPVSGSGSENHRRNTIRILGLGGSMRYKYNAGDMYTEKEMQRRILRLRGTVLKDLIEGRLKRSRDIDVLLTHAPCKGFGDMEDLPHNGFECFNQLLYRHRPILHCYGHVHKEYGNFRRIIEHPSGTKLVNASGYYIFEI